jgi:hypothetical protein
LAASFAGFSQSVAPCCYYNSCLVTWAVVGLATTKLKYLILSTHTKLLTLNLFCLHHDGDREGNAFHLLQWNCCRWKHLFTETLHRRSCCIFAYFAVVNGQQATLQGMVSSRMLRRVALVRTDVSEELSASFIRVTRIGELETTLAVTSNRRTLWRHTCFFAACVSC